MALEIEIKFKVESHEAIVVRLIREGGEKIGRVKETNRIFDDSSQSLRHRGLGLRVRTVEVLEGPALSSTLTYKGPIQPGSIKTRMEIETPIGNSQAVMEILQALSYAPFITFEKIRESWRLEACKIELDELPILGKFVEIEGPDRAAIENIAGRLGFQMASSISHTYIHMLQAMTQGFGEKTPIYRFENKSRSH